MNEFDFLRNDEKLSLKLRALYDKNGYKHFRMSRFEDYDLYAKNKEYLISKGVISFTDGGRLLALKPDVTLSIIKNMPSGNGYISKLCYNESVFRRREDGNFGEIMQTGIECIGDIGDTETDEITRLAVESLLMTDERAKIVFTNTSFLVGEIEKYAKDSFSEVYKAITAKNKAYLQNKLTPEALEALLPLTEVYESADSLKEAFGEDERIEELSKLLIRYPDIAAVDFTTSDVDAYYSGVSFKGYIYQTSEVFLSGGRYDSLMRKMNKSANAAGFAVYVDALNKNISKENDGYINIALPKGRLGDSVYNRFVKAGLGADDYSKDNRKLTFENKKEKLRYFFVKPSDVAIYVERGAADIGVCGKDIVLESQADLYELCDLGVGKCRMCVAAVSGFEYPERTLKVATKFENIARAYYSSLSRDIDIIHLNGSIEIAPLLGLSDVIVDIVETGKTLKENGLVVYEEITDISAELICNKISYKFNRERAEYIKRSIEND